MRFADGVGAGAGALLRLIGRHIDRLGERFRFADHAGDRLGAGFGPHHGNFVSVLLFTRLADPAADFLLNRFDRRNPFLHGHGRRSFGGGSTGFGRGSARLSGGRARFRTGGKTGGNARRAGGNFFLDPRAGADLLLNDVFHLDAVKNGPFAGPLFGGRHTDGVLNFLRLFDRNHTGALHLFLGRHRHADGVGLFTLFLNRNEPGALNFALRFHRHADGIGLFALFLNRNHPGVLDLFPDRNGNHAGALNFTERAFGNADGIDFLTLFLNRDAFDALNFFLSRHRHIHGIGLFALFLNRNQAGALDLFLSRFRDADGILDLFLGRDRNVHGILDFLFGPDGDIDRIGDFLGHDIIRRGAAVEIERTVQGAERGQSARDRSAAVGGGKGSRRGFSRTGGAVGHCLTAAKSRQRGKGEETGDELHGTDLHFKQNELCQASACGRTTDRATALEHYLRIEQTAPTRTRAVKRRI